MPPFNTQLDPALKLLIRAEILRLSLTVALELLYRGNYLFITISLLYKLMIFIMVFTHTHT